MLFFLHKMLPHNIFRSHCEDTKYLSVLKDTVSPERHVSNKGAKNE